MIRKILCFNAMVVALLGAVFLVYPALRAALDLRDPALRRAGIPAVAWRLYSRLTPRYAAWARQRVAQGQAELLPVNDISGTEWPLFGSVFYLWGIENLQQAWDAGDRSNGVEPRTEARDTIVAASELVLDPKQAAWVKKHWGDNYLHEENVFYRMLLIAAATSREKLLRDGVHTNLLRDQVETLSAELEASHSGLLNDYPGQCFPGDVAQAVACIRRADSVLGTDHTRFVARAVRGFIGPRATPQLLPPYQADAKSGLPRSQARGCANSYLCLAAPEIWPYQARQWFEAYDRLFWQERFSAVGYREVEKEFSKSDWTADVDAGPVIAGHGVSASAFGMGAARRNGRFDRAYPLAAEMLATAWELPNGTLAVPRLLSNLSAAPLLGEAAMLWLLTLQPERGFAITASDGKLPRYVYILLLGAFLLGALVVLEGIWRFKLARFEPAPEVSAPPLQTGIWAALVLGSLAAFAFGPAWLSAALLLMALCLPIKKKLPPDDDSEPPDQPGSPKAPPGASATKSS